MIFSNAILLIFLTLGLSSSIAHANQSQGYVYKVRLLPPKDDLVSHVAFRTPPRIFPATATALPLPLPILRPLLTGKVTSNRPPTRMVYRLLV